MTIDKILVALFSLSGAVFTYWFFLMKKEVAVNAMEGAIDIKVDGGYTPDVITIPKGKTTKINFFRKDPSTCLEEVVISEFKLRKFLPLDKTVTIDITAKKEGEYKFSCGMNMFHGKIIVR